MQSQFQSVFQLQNDCQHFRTMQFVKTSLGCPVLDSFLRGGLPVQGINEIAGESGSGKTQLAIQLSLANLQQKLGPEGNHSSEAGTAVVYICTEDTFPVKRLRQMIDCRPEASTAKTDVMDRMFLEHVNDVEELFRILQTKVPIMMERHNVKLVVIDSVAAVFRCENAWTFIEKARKLCFLGSLLHRLNREHEAIVVCINQVTDIVCDIPSSKQLHQRTVQPSLGLAWSNCVTTRIMLARMPSQPIVAPSRIGTNLSAAADDRNQPIVIRRLDVLLSPNLPRSSQHFFVNSSGVHGIQA